MIGLVVPKINYVSYIFEKCLIKQINKKKNIYKCTYYNKDFLLIVSGIGKVNISLATQYLINNYEIDYVISLGIVSCRPCKNLEIFDIIIPLEITQNNQKYLASKKLNKKIINCLKYTNNNYYERDIFTSEDLFPCLSKDNNLADYDLGVIGQVCENKKIPFTGIKILTFFLNCTQLKQYYFYQDDAFIKSNIIFLDYLIT